MRSFLKKASNTTKSIAPGKNSGKLLPLSLQSHLVDLEERGPLEVRLRFEHVDGSTECSCFFSLNALMFVESGSATIFGYPNDAFLKSVICCRLSVI